LIKYEHFERSSLEKACCLFENLILYLLLDDYNTLLTKVNGRYIKLVDGKMDMGLSENRKWTYCAISSSHGDNNGIIRYII
jgi:hypothetical protein